MDDDDKIKRRIFSGRFLRPRLIKVPKLSANLNKQEIRDWWHNILSNHGKYSCSTFILALPSDTNAVDYLKKSGNELNTLSDKDCLVIILSTTTIQGNGTQSVSYTDEMMGQIENGYSASVAKYFDIGFEEFPCLVFFDNMLSTEHLIISLKDLDTEEIGDRLRETFTVIRRANTEKQIKPLEALEKHLQEQEKQANKERIVNKVRSFAGKTYEMAITAFVLGSSSK